MIALTRILVPTDFSDASAAAVSYGIAFARAFNAELHLLHVVVRHELDVVLERQRVLDLFLSGGADGTEDASAEVLEQHAARELLEPAVPEQDRRDVKLQYVLREAGQGGPYLEIVRYADERGVDLIVMGTHGRGFVAHAFVGSVAERVVRKAPCPVLTVHHPEHEFVLPETAVPD